MQKNIHVLAVERWFCIDGENTFNQHKCFDGKRFF
jgi:hypothetical protein